MCVTLALEQRSQSVGFDVYRRKEVKVVITQTRNHLNSYLQMQQAVFEMETDSEMMAASETNFVDLNDDCLAEIFKYLSKFDLFVWRDMHSRFASPSEICFKRNFADHEFVIGEWSFLSKYPGFGLKRLIAYFGRFINNVCLDRKFIEAIKSDSIAAEQMPNVKRMWVGFVSADEIGFLAHWKKIEELTICDFDAQMHWLHNADGGFTHFLESHPKIRKFHLKGNHSEHGEQLIAAITSNLRSLVSLNVGDMSPNTTNASSICGLSNLEHLVMQIDNNVEPFKQLTKLRHLEILNKISRQHLLDLVEAVPTLCHIELARETGPTFTRNTVDDLLKKRMLSPFCDTEKLHIVSPLDQMYGGDDGKSALIAPLENKYVSCYFLDCDDEHAVLANWSVASLVGVDIVDGSNVMSIRFF